MSDLEMDENFSMRVGDLAWKHDGGVSIDSEWNGGKKTVWYTAILSATNDAGRHIASLFLNAPRIGSNLWTAYRIGYPIDAAENPEVVTRTRDAVIAFQKSGFPIEPFEIPPFNPNGKRIVKGAI